MLAILHQASTIVSYAILPVMIALTGPILSSPSNQFNGTALGVGIALPEAPTGRDSELIVIVSRLALHQHFNPRRDGPSREV